MKVIWKHKLKLQATQYIKLPEEALALCVQIQHGHPSLWALVDSDKPSRLYYIEIVGTGQGVKEGVIYHGTFQVQDGDYIFHVFSEPSLGKITL